MRLIISAAVIAVVAGNGLAALPLQTERSGLQGTYEVVDMVEGGVKIAVAELKTMTVTWKGDHLSVSVKKPDQKDETIVAAFDLSLQAGKSPQPIDLTLTISDDKGKKFPGILKVDGDRVVLCFDEDGNQRPTTFASLPKTAVTLLTLKKKK
jgi:uncharacterized protein (TIGR03067 family)